MARAFEFLNETNRIEFVEAFTFIRNSFEDHKELSDEKKLALLTADQSKLAKVRLLLNLLEDVAIGVQRDYADEQVLYSSLSVMVPTVFNLLRFYIVDCQQKYGPNVYRWLEKLVNQWNEKRSSSASGEQD